MNHKNKNLKRLSPKIFFSFLTGESWTHTYPLKYTLLFLSQYGNFLRKKSSEISSYNEKFVEIDRTFFVRIQPFHATTFGKKIKFKKNLYIRNFWFLYDFFVKIRYFSKILYGKHRFPQWKVHIWEKNWKFFLEPKKYFFIEKYKIISWKKYVRTYFLIVRIKN